jgi:hypothetical protein
MRSSRIPDDEVTHLDAVGVKGFGREQARGERGRDISVRGTVQNAPTGRMLRNVNKNQGGAALVDPAARERDRQQGG